MTSIQSELSICDLNDALTAPPEQTLARYRAECEAHNGLTPVFEQNSPWWELSGVAERPACQAPLSVSVPSWSDAKGHTEYLIATSLRANPAACVYV